MKILLLIDKPNWAYHSIAKSLVKYNPYSDVNLSITHIKKNSKAIKRAYKRFDRVLVMGWQNYDLVSFLPKSITMVGIHSFRSWDKLRTTPEKDVTPPSRLTDFLGSFYRVNAVSRRLTDLFCKSGVTVNYTPNGVDTAVFRPSGKPANLKLVVGYSGNKSHDWLKGITEFIIPAAQKAGYDVKLAMRNTPGHVSLEDMPKFYDQVDVYVCASSSEGMSLSVLEAGACGCPIIGTRVSGNTEIIKDGETGFLVDRDVNDIVTKLQYLKKSRVFDAMRESVARDMQDNWCWRIQAKAWIDCLRT